MIIKKYPNLLNNKFIKFLNKLFSSEWSMIIILIITCLSNLFSLEIFMLYNFMSIVILTVLFSDDMIAVVPIFFCSYISFSRKNNPGSYEGGSIFRTSYGLTHMAITCTLVVVFLITRLIYEIKNKKENFGKPKFFIGLILISLSFLFGGLFTEYFSWHSVFIGFIQAISWITVYFYFYYTIDFKARNKDYCLKLIMGIGLVLALELINMLRIAEFWTKPEDFNRSKLFTGWGHYNNVGGMLVITMCVPFYYACKKDKYNILYLLLGNFMASMVALSQSRGSIVAGIVIFILSNIYMFIITKGNKRFKLIVTQVICLCLLLTFFSIKIDTLKMQFDSLINAGFESSGRIDLYKKGLQQFIDNPILGNSFIACPPEYQWGDHPAFWPARYHNTYVQFLATAGIVGILSYLFHRYQTIKVIYKNYSLETLFLSIVILSIIGINVLDCHFFNVGPALIYSGVLLFLEKQTTMKLSK